MNTIQPNFSRLHKNYYNKNQATNTAKAAISANKPELAKISASHMKANYLVSFKGGIKYEESDNSGIGTVNHQTAFFREPKTDELVQNYILENFDNNDEINIVSGACSTGEEAKSYAMMLDSIKNLNIYGFDISKEVVDTATSGDCQLVRAKNNQLGYTVDLDSENMLLDDASSLSEYQQKCHSKFWQYYTPKGDEYRISVFPNAKQELKDLMAQLDNPEKYEELKRQYDENIQIIAQTSPELAEYMPDISFEESMEMSQQALKRQSEEYKTVRDFTADMSHFKNCSFVQGDIMHLDSLYKPNSVNVLLYRNALYHTLCMGDNMFRFMKDDAKDTMDLIAKQMNKILKPQGLVVFGEKEWLQGIDSEVVNEAMKNNGFKLLQDAKDSNIWVKAEDIEA